MDQLYELFLTRGVPQCIRCDNGPEFATKAVLKWLNRLDVTTLFIEPGSPWENGSIESFNGKMRDELLNGEVLDTLAEAKVLVYQPYRPALFKYLKNSLSVDRMSQVSFSSAAR